ncbi:putative uncharacterized protein [Clostridium sp. CAG:167]|nr:putative uncharacterized protein [Clostridium sp. CAG:167]
MRNRFARFMYGRYGVDALNNFLFGLYVALFVLELFFRRTVAGQVMVILGYPIILLYFFRCFSRNIYKRSAENQRFLKLWNPVKNYGHYIKMKFVERGGTKKLCRCPKCHQIIRVPKGKGKIAITCPKCRFEFIKRT